MVLIGSISQRTVGPSRAWLLLAAALVVGWLFNTVGDCRKRQKREASTTAVLQEAKESLLAYALAQHSAKPDISQRSPYRATSQAPDWSSELHNTDDLMAFIERARLDAGSGGYYYAMKAYDFCAREARVAGQVPRLDVLFSSAGRLPDVRQMSAWMRITALCRNFPEAHGALNYAALTEEGLVQGDPKLSLALRLERLSTAPSEAPEFHDAALRSELFTRIFASGDPMLLRDLAAELRVMQRRVQFAVEGEAVAEHETPAFLAAIEQTACQMDRHCPSANEVKALLACAHGTSCEGGGPGAEPADGDYTQWVATVQKWRHRVTAAVQRGDGSALSFTPRAT